MKIEVSHRLYCPFYYHEGEWSCCSIGDFCDVSMGWDTCQLFKDGPVTVSLKICKYSEREMNDKTNNP